MTTAEIVAIIGSLMLIVSTLTGAVVSIVKLFSETKINKEKIAELQKAIDEYKRQQERNRTDVILIGEALADARHDTAAMALLINQLFDQFKDAVGKAPDVNIEMLRQMRTIGYITGPLGPLDVTAARKFE